jgi:hypothetical protein
MNPEDLLNDALHDRVERTDYPSTPLSAIAGRAGAIRARRRRTTFLAAAAVVAVIVVPGAVWLGRSPGGSPQPNQTSSSGPTSSPTTQTSTPPTLSLDALPMGQKPGIDYIDGDTYVGKIYAGPVTSPVLGRATAVAPVRGGLVAATPGAASTELSAITQLSSTGAATSLGCGAGTFALSTDGTLSAYWLKDSCTGTSGGKLYSGALSAMGEAGAGFVTTAPGAIVQPIGILQQGIVVNAAEAGTTRAQLVDYTGKASPIAGLSSAGGSDENNDVVSGQLSGDTGTGAVVNVGDGSVVCRVPSWQLGQFSNDGKYVVGVQPADGFADTYAIFDAASCQRVAGLETLGNPVSTRIRQVAWDFNDTLLAVVDDAQEQAIVRFDLDGHASLATPTRPATDGNDVYRLATRS